MQIAAGVGEHDRGRPGDGGEELAVLAALAVGGDRELGGDGLAVAVGQERVVPGPRGQDAFGQADDDDRVQVEAEGQRQGPDQDAVTEASAAAEVGLQLEGQGAGEAVEAGGGGDGVEPAEAVDGGVDLLGGVPFPVRPGGPDAGVAEVAVEQAGRLVGQLAPGRELGHGVEPFEEAEDEVAQLQGLRGVAAEPAGGGLAVVGAAELRLRSPWSWPAG